MLAGGLLHHGPGALSQLEVQERLTEVIHVTGKHPGDTEEYERDRLDYERDR